MMHNQEELLLLAFIRSVLVCDAEVVVGPETPLFEDGLINSINILSLMGYVERRLGRRLEDDEIVMASFRTVSSIVGAFFREGCSAAAPSAIYTEEELS